VRMPSRYTIFDKAIVLRILKYFLFMMEGTAVRLSPFFVYGAAGGRTTAADKHEATRPYGQ
jgi:hypothetical protein